MPPSTDGQWTGVTLFSIPNPTVDDGAGHSFVDTRGLFVLHAIMLYTGKVLCFCGHVETQMYAPLCYLFDPKNPGAVLSPVAFPAGSDLFCCHYVQIPDGRILAMGGSQHDTHNPVTGGTQYRGSTGSQVIALFDPGLEQWFTSKTGGVTNELRQGRWYPTAVTLPDGRVAVFSGRREINDVGSFPPGVLPPGIASMVEILRPPNWDSVELTGATKDLPIYPGLHLAPDGRIYFTHTCWGQEIPNPETASLLIPDGATSATWRVYAGMRPPHPRREEGMSALLPPGADGKHGKILVIGGSRALKAGLPVRGVLEPPAPTGPAAFNHIEDLSDTLAADILDTTTDPPAWSSVGPMGHSRINGHCVLLPDATVLICGGHNNYKWLPPPATTPSPTAEIYTPDVGFRSVAAMHEPRMYHSVALLLSDGRVFTAGGADPSRSEPVPAYPPGWAGRMFGGAVLNAKAYEIYEPPYMFNGPRPKIDDVLRNDASTRRVEYGQQFKVKTAQAANIENVAFMRPAACTHHTDSDQRYVRLTFTKGSGELTVTPPADGKLAPPGYYMLWIVDNQKRPCEEAVFVNLLPATGQPGGGTSCFIATAALGSADHPGVAYLQALREEVRSSSSAGRRFIEAVTRIYESFSPSLASKIACDSSLRGAVRDCVVKPAITVIRRSERLSRFLPSTRLRHGFLMALLVIDTLAGIIALPGIIAAVHGRTLLNRLRKNSPGGDAN